MNRSSLVKAMTERRPSQGVASGPLVTIVILNRNGAHHLRRLLTALRDRTVYEDFKVLVVDMDTAGQSPHGIETRWPFEVTLIKAQASPSISNAIDQGIKAATGGYVLLMRDDLEPINPSWLGVLVETLERAPKLVAAGALVINQPKRRRGRLLPPRRDPSVQSAGTVVDWDNDGIRAKDLASETDPLGPRLGATRLRPAATTSCLMVRRHTLQSVGGLYPTNCSDYLDLDLCLRLHEHGDIGVVGAAALVRHENGAQGDDDPITEITRWECEQRLAERWGPRISRDLRRDVVRHRLFWNERRAQIGIVHGPGTQTERARLLAKALEGRGWRATLLPLSEEGYSVEAKELDVVVTTSPSVDWSQLSEHSIRVAWIQGSTVEWEAVGELDRYPVVLLADPNEANYVQELTGLDPIIFLSAADFAERAEAPSREPTWIADVLVVGDRPESDPRLPHVLEVAPDERLVIAGAGWTDDPRLARYWRSAVDDDQLDSLMAEAGVVFHSTSARAAQTEGEAVLRTLAAGGMPASSNFELSQWLFDGDMPVIATRQDFRQVVETYAHNPAERNRKAAGMRAAAAVHHTYEARAATLDRALDSALSRPKVAMKISPPNRELARQGGDMHFARQFGRALRRIGLQTRVDLRPDWDQPGTQDADIVVHLRGLDVYTPKPGSVNVLWIVSHPADVTPAECERYDLVLVASHSFAEQLQETVDVPVFALLQATDPFVFHPVETDPRLHAETLFVGNARWPPRIAPRWAMELDVSLAIYGARWENLPEFRYVVDTYFPNERLNTLYASVDIVLNDHWADMKAHGFISNRLFDVLSAGGFVLSDHVDGITQVFDGAIPTYRTKRELAELFERFRDDPLARAKHALHGMQHVHREHTFDARARDFVRFLADVAPSVPLDVAGITRSNLLDLAARADGNETEQVDP